MCELSYDICDYHPYLTLWRFLPKFYCMLFMSQAPQGPGLSAYFLTLFLTFVEAFLVFPFFSIYKSLGIL